MVQVGATGKTIGKTGDESATTLVGSGGAMERYRNATTQAEATAAFNQMTEQQQKAVLQEEAAAQRRLLMSGGMNDQLLSQNLTQLQAQEAVTGSVVSPATGQPLNLSGGGQVGYTQIAQQYINNPAAFNVGAPQTAAQEVTVLRPTNPALSEFGPYAGGYNKKPTGQTVPLSQYEGEYAQKVSDPAFREWLVRRGAVLTGMDPDDPRFLSAGYTLWQSAGQFVASNPTLRKTMTPEKWLDLQYEQMGGDAVYEQRLADIKAANNPISTNTTTTSYTVNAAQAKQMVDQMSQSLLGRMASDAELKRARASVQRLLTPTVQSVTTDATDPSNVSTSQTVKAGVSPSDAEAILARRMQRGSEGMAFNVGTQFEAAMRMMGA